jgi:hypothetical protein
MNMEQWWDDGVENQSASGKTCHSAPLSTTNSTLAALGFNPGLHSEKPVTTHKVAAWLKAASSSKR